MLERIRPLLRWRGPGLIGRYADLIDRHARGASFADVGCMWNVDGAWAFRALEAGATRVVGIDLMPPTAEFLAQNEARGRRVEFLQGDINDPSTTAAIGTVDCVFCAGVLYHVPNPLATLAQLRRICRKTLVLICATIREQHVPQAAVFLPHLDDGARRRLNWRSSRAKIGLDTAFDAAAGYANWFWAFTPSCVEGMVLASGFEVTERYRQRHALCLVCHPV